MMGELVKVGAKLGDPGSLSNPAAAAAALAALAYTAAGVTGAETSASEMRGRFTPMLKEWRREAGRSKALHGWLVLSLARSASSARAAAFWVVRKRFILMVSTLASSWIKKTVLNIGNKKNRIAIKLATVEALVPLPLHMRFFLLSVHIIIRRIIRFSHL
jgi:hypothetical protein